MERRENWLWVPMFVGAFASALFHDNGMPFLAGLLAGQSVFLALFLWGVKR